MCCKKAGTQHPAANQVVSHASCILVATEMALILLDCVFPNLCLAPVSHPPMSLQEVAFRSGLQKGESLDVNDLLA